MFERKDCPMRHPDNGNCLPAGGFCTAVNDPICEALHHAYRHGKGDAIEMTMLSCAEQTAKFEQARLDVLRQIHKKVTNSESLRPKGEWKHNEYYEEWAERYVCSVCNRNAPSDGDYREMLSNFCPNCGADMRGNNNG